MRTVVDDESLVAARHEVAGLLVGAVADLHRKLAKIITHNGPTEAAFLNADIFFRDAS